MVIQIRKLIPYQQMIKPGLYHLLNSISRRKKQERNLKCTSLFAKKCTSLFAKLCTFLIAKICTLLFTVYKNLLNSFDSITNLNINSSETSCPPERKRRREPNPSCRSVCDGGNLIISTPFCELKFN